MYIERKFQDYLDDLAAKKPAPGGGSAAAAAGALGVSLLSMVANFTIGKEKYKDVEAEIQQILDTAEKSRAELQKLIDEDVAAYQKVSAAYKMPKDTEEDKRARTEAIQTALKDAMAVPLAICRNLFEAAKLCEPLLEKGNINLVSLADNRRKHSSHLAAKSDIAISAKPDIKIMPGAVILYHNAETTCSVIVRRGRFCGTTYSAVGEPQPGSHRPRSAPLAHVYNKLAVFDSSYGPFGIG